MRACSAAACAALLLLGTAARAQDDPCAELQELQDEQRELEDQADPDSAEYQQLLVEIVELSQECAAAGASLPPNRASRAATAAPLAAWSAGLPIVAMR